MFEKGLDHEYLPIDGHASFVMSSLKLSFGEKFYEENEKKLACVQTLGGTGAFRLALDFLSRFLPSFSLFLEISDIFFD